MSTLFKILLIAYIIYKFYKLFFVTIKRSGPTYQRNTSGNEPHVHKTPKNNGKQGKSYEGGEYIDYEEVK